MCNQLSQFTIEKYVHLKGFLDVENCNELTAELKRLVKAKQTVNDVQCPTSEAIHGAMAFDKLLVDLLPHFEKASGKRLYPTYSYARLYKKGEKLKIHTDRESCEISATLTLGFDGEAWPIYMGDEGEKTLPKSLWVWVMPFFTVAWKSIIGAKNSKVIGKHRFSCITLMPMGRTKNTSLTNDQT